MARKQLYPPSVDPGFPELPACPKGWSETTFGDVFEVQTRPIKLEPDGRYKLVVARRNRGGIELRSEVRGGEVLTKTQYKTHEGDFLISRRQIIHGACGVVPAHLHGAVVSNEYSALRTKAGYVMDYFRHFSHSPYFQRTCFHSSHGVDVEKMIFKLDEWLARPVQVPPIGEQLKIAAILSSVDEAIEKTQAVIDQVQVVKKGLMQELLTRGLPGRHKKFKQTEIGEIPASWEVVKLGDVCDVFNGRAAKTGGSKLRVFKTKHVYDGPLRLDRPEYVPDDLASKVPASTHLQPGDVLTPNMAHGTIGRIAYAERVERDWTVDGQIMVIRSRKPEAYHPKIVYEVLSSHRGRRALLDLEKGGAFDTLRGQTHIYPRDVAMIPIPVIPVDQQGMIAATADSMDQYVLVLESEVGALKLVKQALMSILLAGELRVTS